jgi:hypothetical protein
MAMTPLTSEQNMQNRMSRELRKKKIQRLFQFAEKYGVIKRGWSCIDYMFDAVKNMGWESTCISGPKGTAKSNLMLQHGKAIYGDITTARGHVVVKRKQLLDHMEYAIDNELRIPWEAVDDIGAIFPKSLYFTHRKLYSKLQSAWETTRTVFNCFEFSCTLKRKVAGFIMEDITGDIKTYNRCGDLKSHYDYRRWLWMRNLKDPTSDIAKLISIEDIAFPLIPEAFELDKTFTTQKYYIGGIEYAGEAFYREHAMLTGISREEFKGYWNDRLEIAKVSFKDFKDILEEPEPKQKKLTPMQTQPSIEVASTEDKPISAREMGLRSAAKRRANAEELQRLREHADKIPDDSTTDHLQL